MPDQNICLFRDMGSNECKNSLGTLVVFLHTTLIAVGFFSTQSRIKHNLFKSNCVILKHYIGKSCHCSI